MWSRFQNSKFWFSRCIGISDIDFVLCLHLMMWFWWQILWFDQGRQFRKAIYGSIKFWVCIHEHVHAVPLCSRMICILSWYMPVSDGSRVLSVCISQTYLALVILQPGCCQEWKIPLVLVAVSRSLWNASDKSTRRTSLRTQHTWCICSEDEQCTTVFIRGRGVTSFYRWAEKIIRLTKREAGVPRSVTNNVCCRVPVGDSTTRDVPSAKIDMI